jgi:hypothetical protein
MIEKTVTCTNCVIVLKRICHVLDLYQIEMNEQDAHLMKLGTYEEAGI